ncbi:TIGR03086 family metal-binding protein [Actinosynnema sp. NPDC023587]|uniref:TIGR03086 family metal-binding protein n=1 Tax=Actinosynnema sp. NPDC023587 TaxID=3154695 RepID=UPI0033E0287A
MNTERLAGLAAAPVLEIVDGITPDQLDAPTPCAEFDVRGLIRHLLFWGPSLEAAARKENVTPEGAESDVDLTDWRPRLRAQWERIAAAWGAPEAWQGTTVLGSPNEMPAGMIGGMVVGEVLVHGWDLATALGRTPTWDDEVLSFVHADLVGSAPVGREMGLFGPEVPVPDDAPLLDRLLGLTGREV